MNTASPKETAFPDWLAVLREGLAMGRQRRLVCLAGRRDWALSLAAELAPVESGLWVGDDETAPPNWPSSQATGARDCLGSELDLAAWDAWAGLDPDGFGALSGAIRAGGVLILCCPPLDDWPHYADPEHVRLAVEGYPMASISGRFLARFARCLREDEDVLVVREGAPLPPLPAAPVEAVDDPQCYVEQGLAIEEVCRVAGGRRRRPLVLTADRGRGKSAALGFAAARLHKQMPQARILLTAPRHEQCEAVYRFAGAAAPIYVSPADLLEQTPPADLLLVDEAAGIAPDILQALLLRYNRIVFSTTVHGYEGTGRGFSLRFRSALDRDAPGWRQLELREPMRWAADDPLERLTFSCLLLNAELPEAPAVGSADRLRCRLLDRDALLADEPLLRQVFGLLVQAHYRTRPMDLRHLLDGPNLSVHLAAMADQVVGIALVAEEGGFPPELAEAIWTGRRRPQGHLLPQSLAAHVGVRQGAALRGLRIMRIAVHPDCRRRGVGSALLGSLVEAAEANSLDMIGSSFGVTPDLLTFWWSNGFLPLRVGMRRDAASGTHSLLVARSISDAARERVAEGRHRFRRELPLHLQDTLSTLAWDVCDGVLGQLGEAGSPPGGQDWLDAAAFASTCRAYEASLASLHTLAWWALVERAARHSLTERHRAVFILKLLQGRSWRDTARSLGLSGRGEVIAVLKEAVLELVHHHGPSSVREFPAVWQAQRPDSENC
ncbi:tRNA(Met) cytidine acetyltransferase [Natronocella acetinitrilica]|uniref:tRNA(Met) cytidine acetyltransferase TmcA n=1 Tax=Natronocella acetinitrilica TaxID=414046 RepID=A0AAE3G7C3_9GAMM|nr:GNAT family N-acetyltransferase [Natronocella acetinitrilica]MCP1676136.1 tRNA(Met) cytidine acetyltransferase [Natronocella acetinitrilica]